MSDCDRNFTDGLSLLSSPNLRDVLGILYQNENGLNPISETFPGQTNVSPDPQSDQRSGGLRERMAARLGFDIPPLEIESVSPFANSFRNPILVPSPILILSPGFSLSPFLQSPNNSSSQIIPPCPTPNDAPPETVESSGGTHSTMMISNKNLPHQPMDADLPPQGGTGDIPTEESVDIISNESNADPIGAPLVSSFDSEVVAETDVMNPISLESCSKDNDKDRDYNREDDKFEDHNVVVDPPSRKRKRKSQVNNNEENVVSNIMGATRQKNKPQRVLVQVESEQDHPDDGFRWREYGRKVLTGNANPRTYYRCSYTGCKVKKLVERNVENVKFVVAIYDGVHEHVPPPERKTNFGSSMSQDSSNQTFGFGMVPSSVSASQLFPSPLAPQMDMTQFYFSGLSKMTSLPVNKNHGVTNPNDEPKTDRVIPDGTEVFKGIRERLLRNFGTNL